MGALGDSCAAGVFVGDPGPALGSADRDGCDRAAGAYPNLVATALAANGPAVALTGVSCGGAVIGEIARSGQTPISPVGPPGEGRPAVAVQTCVDIATTGKGHDACAPAPRSGPRGSAAGRVRTGRPA